MSLLARQCLGVMRQTFLHQAELSQVAVPKLRSRAVIQAIETLSREEREVEARHRLWQFRETVRNRAAYRLLRQPGGVFRLERSGQSSSLT